MNSGLSSQLIQSLVLIISNFLKFSTMDINLYQFCSSVDFQIMSNSCCLDSRPLLIANLKKMPAQRSLNDRQTHPHTSLFWQSSLGDLVFWIIYLIMFCLLLIQQSFAPMNEEPQYTPEQKHAIWMKNSGYLYDRLVVHKMKWPSLTFQWMPTIKETINGIAYQVVVATHTSGTRDTEFISILQIQFPYHKDLNDPNPVMTPATVRKVQQFKHEIEPNRVRYSQSDPSLLAVRVDQAPIAILKRGKEFPQTLLSGHNFDSGFALQWSKYGLISGDHKGNVVIWQDIQREPYKFHYDSQIQDTKFIQKNIFATASDDGMMCVWDLRSGKPQTKIAVSDKELYSVAVNPVNKNLILTAGEEGPIKLWDARSYSSKLFKFQGHQKAVLNVHWSPKTPTIFASGGQDSKVKIWDFLRVGFQIPKDNSGTDQLLFTHQGHQDDVLDLGWNPHCMLLGSTEQKYNSLQLYEISNCIQELQYAEDMDFLREQCLS